MQFSGVDFFDIALMSCLLYFLMQRLRTSRAFAILIALVVFRVLYYIAGYFGLYTLYWLLSHVFDSLFILIVVIFHPDIRKALVDIGNMSFFHAHLKLVQDDASREVIDACMEMARRRQGALIVFERYVSLNDIMNQEGQKVDDKKVEGK